MTQAETAVRIGSVFVDRDRCVGSGLCIAIAPGIFALDAAGQSTVTREPSPAETEGVLEAADTCPVMAISIPGTRPSTRTTDGGRA